MNTKIFSSTVACHTSANIAPSQCQLPSLDQSFYPAVTFAEESLSALSLPSANNVSIKSIENDAFLNAMQDLQAETEKLWQDGVINADTKTCLEQSSATILNVKLFLLGLNLNDAWFEEAVAFNETASALIEHLRKHPQILSTTQHIKFLKNLRAELLTNLELKNTAQYHQSKRDQSRFTI